MYMYIYGQSLYTVLSTHGFDSHVQCSTTTLYRYRMAVKAMSMSVPWQAEPGSGYRCLVTCQRQTGSTGCLANRMRCRQPALLLMSLQALLATVWLLSLPSVAIATAPSHIASLCYPK